jgi:pimeloyl-ACP methyl ester carboxylesterase
MTTTAGCAATLVLIGLAASARSAVSGAAPNPSVGEAISAAAINADTITINSTILGRSRSAFVSLPASHARTTRSYPVIIVLDGEANFTGASTIANTLASLGHVPDFIENELLREVAAKYRGGKPYMLVGHSSGGVIVTHAAATRTASFPVVVSIDAPIHLGEHWLAQRFIERAKQPGAPPLRYVSLETRFGWSDRTWSELKAAAPQSWQLRREKLDGESHESMGFLSMYQGLKFAFLDFSIVGAPLVPRASANAAFAHYARIGQELGSPLPPPTRVLNRLVEDLLTEGSVDAARQALKWLVDGYGAQQNRAELEGMITRVEAQLPLKETVEMLKATPLPSPEEIAPYVGEWRGHNWMNPESKNAAGLRIRIVNGKVVAEQLHWFDGVEQAEPMQYLKVVPGGLHFGQMNGMRPLGMLVSEGKLSGNVLEGQSGFRGIVLPLPTGRMPPKMNFRYERQ